jgi:hypothetical protein
VSSPESGSAGSMSAWTAGRRRRRRRTTRSPTCSNGTADIGIVRLPGRVGRACPRATWTPPRWSPSTSTGLSSTRRRRASRHPKEHALEAVGENEAVAAGGHRRGDRPLPRRRSAAGAREPRRRRRQRRRRRRPAPVAPRREPSAASSTGPWRGWRGPRSPWSGAVTVTTRSSSSSSEYVGEDAPPVPVEFTQSSSHNHVIYTCGS